MRNELSAADMHALLKNERRVDKILSAGNISSSQSGMLLSMYGATKRMRRTWYGIIIAVCATALAIVLFFGLRTIYYRSMVKRGLSVEQKLDAYEARIAQARDRGAGVAALVDTFERIRTRLNTIKGNLRHTDRRRFFADTIEYFIDGIMQRFSERDYHIPPQMAARVKYHIGIYSGRMKKTIAAYLEKKEKYFPMIRRIFSAHRLPVELAYVSMLESGFNPTARSHAGAVGLWQFMAATGRRYGLRVHGNVDDRTDPEKATYAAAEYFKDLIGIFGGKSSVMLAMAAYNAGESRVMGALRKIDDPMRNRDFWYIYRMGYLAEETNEYIPRVLALMIIDSHRSYFGFPPDRSLAMTGE